MSNVEKIVKMMGGQSATALRMGISQQSVCRWISRDRVPAKYIKKVSAMTNNKFTVDQLVADHEFKGEL